MHILTHVTAGGHSGVQSSSGSGAAGPPPPRLRVTDRNPDALRARLEPWLAEQLPGATDVHIASVGASPSNGMSSQSLLLDATWTEPTGPRTAALVVRVAPDAAAHPVYPHYDLERQFRVLRELKATAVVPVPRPLWLEASGTVLGSPFLVMERIDGRIPPDIMPYTFEGWLLDATPDQRAELARRTLAALAALHRLPGMEHRFSFLGPAGLDAHLAAERRYYEWVVGAGERSKLLDRAFAWLAEHRPATESAAVLSWGDARIGNVIYRDFTPVAVLDWETAALAPPEVDLGWFLWLHWSFQELAVMAGLPGLPDFLRVDDVIRDYVAAGGAPPQDLHWYLVYAAVRHSVVISRVGRRMTAFGERAPFADVDELVFNRDLVARLLDGQWPDWAN